MICRWYFGFVGVICCLPCCGCIVLDWGLGIYCLSTGFVCLWCGLICLFTDLLFVVRLTCYLGC